MTALEAACCLRLADRLQAAVAAKPLRSGIEAKGAAEAWRTGAGCCGLLKQKPKKRPLKDGQAGEWARHNFQARTSAFAVFQISCGPCVVPDT